MLWPLAFVTFIAANPGFVAWFIGGLLSIMAVLLVGAYKLVYSQVGELKVVDLALEARVGVVEKKLAAIEPNVGAGEKALQVLSVRIDKHMTEEEQMVWTGIRALGDKLNEIQVENVEAHAQIVTEHGQRLAKIETRMETIQSKMPNGQIAEMLEMLRKLSAA